MWVQETESDGVGVVCSDDIAREHNKVSLPARKNLSSMVIKQQKEKKSPNSFMKEQPCRGYGYNVRMLEG